MTGTAHVSAPMVVSTLAAVFRNDTYSFFGENHAHCPIVAHKPFRVTFLETLCQSALGKTTAPLFAFTERTKLDRPNQGSNTPLWY
jgi:hypothetical protein